MKVDPPAGKRILGGSIHLMTKVMGFPEPRIVSRDFFLKALLSPPLQPPRAREGLDG